MKSKQLFKVFLAGFMMTLCGVLSGFAQDWVECPKALSLEVGGTGTLTVTFDSEYTDTNVTWTYLGRETVVESTADAATVTVKALAEGETFISCDVEGKKGTETRTQTFMIDVNVIAPEATGISLPATAEVKQGATLTLEPTMTPANASTAGLVWTSADEDVATVSDKGVVTGVKASDTEVEITVTTENGKSSKCKVKVTAPDPTGISLPMTEEVKKGETITLTPTARPDGAALGTLTWESSDTEVATVADGVVTGVKVGTATITVKTEKGYPASCVVKVVAPDLTGITLPTETQEVKQGETLKLTATLTPDDATPELTWESENPDVATVSASGVVKGIKASDTEVTITVKAENGKTATCKVKVLAPDPIGIILPAAKEVRKGGTVTLTPTLLPEGASAANLTWTSSDESVATVADGVVTGVKVSETEVTITVKTENGKTAECKVTVLAPDPTDITLPTETQEVKQGETLNLTATLTPDDAEAKLIWSSEKPEIAAVTSTGEVKGIKASDEEVKITVKTKNGKSAECKVKVTAPDPTFVSLPFTQKVKEGEEVTLAPKFTPANAASELTWKSSDESIATVAAGVVKGVKASDAEVTITVTTANGKSAECKVTVLAPDPTEVKLPTETQEVKQGKTITLAPTFTPENAATELTWTSSNPDVATVSNKGVVTGVKADENEVTITVTTANGKTAECKVKVLAPDPTFVSLPTTQEVKVGGKLTLDVTVKPAGVSTEGFTWTSSDETIAKVTKGEVEGVKEGVATITVKTENDLTSFCVVTVVAEDPAEPTAIAAPAEAQEVKQGATLDLASKLTFTPTEAKTEDLAWVSSNSAIATVSDKGVVTGVKASDDEVTITVIYNKNADVKAECKVKVTAPDPTAVSLPESIEVKKGATVELTPDFTPANAVPGTLTWESSDTEVATVADGVVTGVKMGTATITVTTENGKVSQSCEVEVVAPDATEISLPEIVNMFVGGEMTLTPTYDPEDAAAELTWTSSDVTIARVSSEGVVRAINEGAATITVTTAEGLTASCDVIISPDTDIAALNNALYVVSSEVQTGAESYELPICLKNDAAVLGASFTVTLPIGMTFAKAEDTEDNAVCTLNAKRASESKFTVSSLIGTSRTCSISVESNGTDAISKGDGELLTLTVNVDENMKSGDYLVRLTANMLMLNDDENTLLELEDTRSTLEVVKQDVDNGGDEILDEAYPTMFDEPDAITNIKEDMEKGSARYSISGQRVGNGYKGMVIVNGKKVLVK